MKPKDPAFRPRPHPRPAGFSLIELLVVVGIIAIMAAVAIPAIANFLRGYRIRGAAQQVIGEIQTARNKAINKNANQPVIFAPLDANSYRFYLPDEDPLRTVPPPPAAVGPVRDLPQGIVFVQGADLGFGFDRLGRRCLLGSSTCSPLPPVTAATLCPPDDQPRCNDFSPGNYVTNAAAQSVIMLQETVSGATRRIDIAPGGRVSTPRTENQ